MNYLEKFFQIVVFENTLKKSIKKAFQKMKGFKYNVVVKLFFKLSVLSFELINTSSSINQFRFTSIIRM